MILNIQRDMGKYYNHLTLLGDREHLEKTFDIIDEVIKKNKYHEKRHNQMSSKFTKIWCVYIFVTLVSFIDVRWFFLMVLGKFFLLHINTRAFKPINEEWDELGKLKETYHETNPFYDDLIDSYYSQYYKRLPRRIIEFVMESEEDFSLYRMEGSLLPDDALPTGMVMKENYLFESKGKKFQIAINEGTKVSSYIVLPVNGVTGKLDLDDITVEYITE